MEIYEPELNDTVEVNEPNGLNFTGVIEKITPYGLQIRSIGTGTLYFPVEVKYVKKLS